MSELKLHDYMKKQSLILFIILKSLLISETINFNIDMNNLQYPNEDYDNVVINGSWNDWSGWGVTLDDSDGDGIYSGSLNLNNGTYEYVIAVTGSVDNWSGWGQTINAPIGESCDFNPSDEWANYGFTINNVDLDQNYCAGSCINTCSDSNNDNEDNDDNNEENYEGYQLIWNDEFNGSTIDDSKWNNFRWQLQNRVTNLSQLENHLNLSNKERNGVILSGNKLSLSITPHFFNLIEANNPDCPIRKQVIPTVDEISVSSEEMSDPCGEDSHMPVPGLVHRYPDRVLFLLTDRCASYCRYCTRSRVRRGHARRKY